MTTRTHDPLALFLHVGDAFLTLFRHGPRFEANQTGESWVASAGESHCIWTWVGLASASPTNVATLREVVARLRNRRMEGLVWYPPEAETGFTNTFRELGLGQPDGGGPLMVCEAADVPAITPSDVTVERLTGTAMLSDAVAVVSASFEIPPDQVTRVFNADMLDEPAVQVYAARRGGAVAGILASTRFGDTASIDIMAVDPARQRQGIGHTLMLSAMHAQIAAGVTGFHLLSSSEGKGLYDRLGFTTLLPALVRLVPLDPIPLDQVVT